MDDRRWDPYGEEKLERLLSEGLSAPPDYVLAQVTPWRRTINRLLWGLVLCTITFQFWNLDYILPTIGMVLILLSLRALRRENGFFGVWWWTHLFRMGMWSFVLLYQAAPGWEDLLQSSFGTVYAVVNITLQFVQFLCLWQGLRATQSRAGLPPRADGGLALLVWYGVLTVLGVVGYGGWPIAIALIAAYGFILRGLYKLSAELEEAGYALQLAPVRISDRVLAVLLLGGLLLGVLGINLVTSRLPMDWQSLDPEEHRQVEEIKDQLRTLDFPEEVLEDLTAGDILACDGAVRVLCRSEECTLKSVYNDATPRPMRVTAVAVELPDGQWRVIHHFLWTENIGFYGSEAIQLWPAYRVSPEEWTAAGEPSGRVLFDKKGSTYAAPFHSLETVSYTYNTFFFGSEERTDLFATFSLPFRGERCRGYIAYGIAASEERWMINSWSNYVHCLRPIQYPAKTAQAWRMEGNIFSEGLYRVMQTTLQISLNSPNGYFE